MATKEEVLQKVNEYVTEKQYQETLDDKFRSQFSEKFASAYADADLADENILNSIKFNLDSSFSATSKKLKIVGEEWQMKESEYKKRIEALENGPKPKGNEGDTKKFELPEDVKNQLNELQNFKTEKQKQEKRAEVLNLAKKNVREDLHGDLEKLFSIMRVDDSKESSVIAKELNDNFAEVYKNTVGNIKPISSQVINKSYEEMLDSVKKVKI